MRRREFIGGLGSAAVWPVVARARQAERVPRIAATMAYSESDPEGKTHLPTLRVATADDVIQ